MYSLSLFIDHIASMNVVFSVASVVIHKVLKIGGDGTYLAIISLFGVSGEIVIVHLFFLILAHKMFYYFAGLYLLYSVVGSCCETCDLAISIHPFLSLLSLASTPEAIVWVITEPQAELPMLGSSLIGA